MHNKHLDDYKKYEPFFGSWHITRLLGEGSFGKVFEIEREDFGKIYKSALKIISIPQNEGEVKSLKAEGMDDLSVTEYYKGFVAEVVNEFAMLAELKGNSNIVSYEDHMVVEHRDSFGWDILIRMELLTPLIDYTETHSFEERDVVKLGADLCRALELCADKNIIHRDIKPENIFVANSGNFKLGDFGIARTAEKTTSGLSKKGTYAYMAPEVYLGKPYGMTVDIYSVGLVLYKLLNGGRAPFMPPAPQSISFSAKEESMARRIRGDKIPAPVNGGQELNRIILKACSYNSDDRYQNAAEMRLELEKLLFLGEISKEQHLGGVIESTNAISKDNNYINELYDDKTISFMDNVLPTNTDNSKLSDTELVEAFDVADRNIKVDFDDEEKTVGVFGNKDIPSSNIDTKQKSNANRDDGKDVFGTISGVFLYISIGLDILSTLIGLYIFIFLPITVLILSIMARKKMSKKLAIVVLVLEGIVGGFESLLGNPAAIIVVIAVIVQLVYILEKTKNKSYVYEKTLH